MRRSTFIRYALAAIASVTSGTSSAQGSTGELPSGTLKIVVGIAGGAQRTPWRASMRSNCALLAWIPSHGFAQFEYASSF